MFKSGNVFKKGVSILILFIIILGMNLPTFAQAADSDANASESEGIVLDVAEDEKDTVQLLNMTDHIKYMENSDGKFRPNDALTRSEAARMFYFLLTEKPIGPAVFNDLGNSDCYYEANTLAALGIMSGYDDGSFRPQNPITRAEFATLLRRFFPNEKISGGHMAFYDVTDDFWGREGILFAAEKNWVNGYPDGSFAPNSNITRAEVTVVMNNVLGRKADEYSIVNGEYICIFMDVPSDFWAFYSIMEASTWHDYIKNDDNTESWTGWADENTGLSQGLYSYNGELYYVNSGGRFVRSEQVGVRYFDQNGRYTTLNAEVDQYLTDILRKYTTDDMPHWDKRYAIYKYIRDNYTYMKRDILTKGTTNWENGYALRFFNEGYGNCFSFAAAYGLLLRKVGYDINFIIGDTGASRLPHGWVEIIVDGKTYVDDPEMDMSYRKKGNYNYNFYNFTYNTAPWAYRK